MKRGFIPVLIGALGLLMITKLCAQKSIGHTSSADLLGELQTLDTLSDPTEDDRYAKAHVLHQLGKIQESINITYQLVEDSLPGPSQLLLHATNLHRGHQFEAAIKYYRAHLALDTLASYSDRQEVIQKVTRALQGLGLKQEKPSPWSVENVGKSVNSAEVVNHVVPVGDANIDLFYTSYPRGFEEMLYLQYRVPSDESPVRIWKQSDSTYSCPLGIWQGEMYYLIDAPHGLKVENFSHNQDNAVWAQITWVEGDAVVHLGDSLMVVASNRRGGRGGRDLYSSIWDGQQWSALTNLGTPVNSPFDEYSIAFDPDGKTSYFSSDRTSSMGGIDLFVAHWIDSTQTWGDIRNMGYPINTASNDYNFRFYPDHQRAVLISDRPGGSGLTDLYHCEPVSQDSLLTPWSASNIKPDLEAIARENYVPIDTPELYLSPIYWDSLADLDQVQNVQKIQELASFLAEDSTAILLVHTFVQRDTNSLTSLRRGALMTHRILETLSILGVDSARVYGYSFGGSVPLAQAPDSNTVLPEDMKRWDQHIRFHIQASGPVKMYHKDLPVPQDLLNPDYLRVSQEFVDTLAYKIYLGNDSTIHQRLQDLDTLTYAMVRVHLDGDREYFVDHQIDYRLTRSLVDRLQRDGAEGVHSEAFYQGRQISEKTLTRLAIPYPQLRVYLGDLLMR